MKKYLLHAAVLLGVSALFAPRADAALNAYLTLKGQKQGDIKGSVTQKGREGKIMVIAVSHEIISPRDPQSGLPTGKRMHKPFVITKELDKSSPLLYNALTSNEKITSFKLEFYAPQVNGVGGAGQENEHVTVGLSDSTIASIDFRILNNKDPNLALYCGSWSCAFTSS